MPTDVTYISLTEKENERKLAEEIARIYRKYVGKNPQGRISVYNSDFGGFNKTCFEIWEDGKRAAYYTMLTHIWQDILRGNKEPKISSKFFTPITSK